MRHHGIEVIEQRLPVQGFCQKRIGSGGVGLADICRCRMTGHGQDVKMRCIRVVFEDLAHLKAVHMWHEQIEDEHMRLEFHDP